MPAVLNAIPLVVLPLALVPFVRPLRASRLGLTELLPRIPLLFARDGTVSAMRAYSPKELLALARAVPGGEGDIGDAGRGGQPLYLTGRPA